MKIGKKAAIATGILLLIGGAILAFVLDEYDDRTRGYETYQTATAGTTTSANTTTPTVHTASGSTSPFTGSEGKISEVSKNQITVEVPLQGSKTFIIDQNTKIEDLFQPLKKGVLVDIHANGESAYHIETEKTIDANGVIVKITDQDVTVNYNGTEETFVKASNFRIDTDGYKGALEGLPTEITLNDQLQVVSLEIDIEDDGLDD
ncbi:hypothetical protein ACFYKT_12545 [Cytobacillus sp. FJAT-53684]|uniref:Uncharacterized protein n=1 Tax=Cytobacillus mangrovibacter TaxID=3299024 RepID=A0ABW6JZ27_9BACI